MIDAIYALISWLGSLVKTLWTNEVDFVNDFFVDSADSVLTAITSVVMAIKAPSFISDHSIGQLIVLYASRCYVLRGSVASERIIYSSCEWFFV